MVSGKKKKELLSEHEFLINLEIAKGYDIGTYTNQDWCTISLVNLAICGTLID